MNSPLRIGSNALLSNTNGIIRTSALTLAAGCGLVVPACIGLGVLPGMPAFPFLTTMAAFLLLEGKPPWTALVLPSLLFFAWSPGLFRGRVEIPMRSRALFAVTGLLTPIWFVIGWKYGRTYQSRFLYLFCAMNVLWLLALWLILAHSRRRASFVCNLLFHWLLFAWLGWCAFPWLGELP
jgi:hypothetical protein